MLTVLAIFVSIHGVFFNILFSWGTVLGCFVKDFLPATLFFSSVRLFIRARVKGSMSSKINIKSQNQNF